jgi:hypothetical protein
MISPHKITFHPHDAAFLKEIKKTILNTSIALSISVTIGFIAFYFNTKNTLEYHQKAIEKLQTDIDFLIQLHCKNDK